MKLLFSLHRCNPILYIDMALLAVFDGTNIENSFNSWLFLFSKIIKMCRKRPSNSSVRWVKRPFGVKLHLQEVAHDAVGNENAFPRKHEGVAPARQQALRLKGRGLTLAIKAHFRAEPGLYDG